MNSKTNLTQTQATGDHNHLQLVSAGTRGGSPLLMFSMATSYKVNWHQLKELVADTFQDPPKAA